MRTSKLITVSTAAVLLGGTSLAIGLESASSLQGSSPMQESSTISQGGAAERGRAITSARARATTAERRQAMTGQGAKAGEQIQGQLGTQPRQSFGQKQAPGLAYGRATARETGVTLNAQQRERLREILSARRDIPRVSSLPDAHINAVIPRGVRLTAVPEEVARMYPRLRGRQAFMYRNDMVVVDPATSRIVARLPG